MASLSGSGVVTSIQKITDFIVRRMADQDSKVDGYMLFEVLREVFETIETNHYIDLELWGEINPDRRKDWEEHIKKEMYMLLGGVDNPEKPDIVIDNYSLNENRPYPQLCRRYRLTMLMVKKDLK